MPEAVSSHTTSAPVGQPDLSAEFDAFDETIQQLGALTEMLAAFMDENAKTTHTHGIYSLFRQQAGDLRAIYGSFKDGVSMLNVSIEQLSRDVATYRQKQDAMQVSAIAERDRLILAMADSGTETKQISQTFNLRRDAVERIIKRLTSSEGDKVSGEGEQAAS
ncbi:hypothetical protein O9X99_16665 [Agrobacterium salinitolerans]|uniref:hypothetical protein n=1 Tax=Agrobacterium salinitolerans TaxID=1183413 RepID=UPI0022B843BF|nr:hypothetical protein [Agrobacterium salinitolerans]MCZ7893305.1 hypothetical protein [Agrobacterium salinitolerans]